MAAPEEEEEELEAVEWVDHSRASALETFSAEVERVLDGWGLGEGGGEAIGDEWSTRSAELSLGHDKYELLLVSDAEGDHFAAARDGLQAALSPCERDVLRGGFRGGSDALATWFGVDSYVLAAPLERTANLNDVSLLLSSLGMALERCAPPVPVIVAVPPRKGRGVRHRLARSAGARMVRGALDIEGGEPEERVFGICATGLDYAAATVHLNAAVLWRAEVPRKHQDLAGLTHLFKCKVWPRHAPEEAAPDQQAAEQQGDSSTAAEWGALARGQVLVSVQFTYSHRKVRRDPGLLAPSSRRALVRAAAWTNWFDDDVSWRLHALPADDVRAPVLDALRGGLDRPPLWGPLEDPLRDMHLRVLWPSFRESAYVENKVFSSLVPESAPTWLLWANPKSEEDLLERQRAAQDRPGARLAPPDRAEAASAGAASDAADDVLWMCPLAKNLWCVWRMLSAAQDDEYRGQVLADIKDDEECASEPGMAGDLARERRLVRKLARDLLRRRGPRGAGPALRAELEQLEAEYMQGGMSSAALRARRRALVAEAEREIPEELTDAHTPPESPASCAAAPGGAPFSILRQPCPECWLCSDTSVRPRGRQTRRKLRTAPVGSLLSVLASRVVPEFGASMGAFSALWAEFVSELRWHWDNLVLVPLEPPSREEEEETEDPKPVPVDRGDCLLHQKVALLNLCIAAEAHKRFGHASSPHAVGETEAEAAGTQWDADDEASAVSAEESDEGFFDSRGGGEDTDIEGATRDDPATAELLRPVREPWTVETCLMTEDQIAEREELLLSLALNSDTAGAHEKLLLSILRSEMQAFKVANPEAGFNAFRRWKGRSRRLGEYWERLWDSCPGRAVREQVQDPDPVFNASQEAERLLHHLETVTPHAALSQLFGLAAEAAEFVLGSAAGSMSGDAQLCQVLSESVLELRAQVERALAPQNLARASGDVAKEASVLLAKQRSLVEAVEASERLMCMSASLLHKLPGDLVASMLREERRGEGGLCAALDASRAEERRHVRGLLFPETSDDSFALPEPDEKEYVLRCLARRPAFRQPGRPGGDAGVRPGANRMYVRFTRKHAVIATTLTETSF